METGITLKFGKRVKTMRLKKGMSQGDVAKKMNVGVAYISKIERGTENMSLKNIERLARALGVHMKGLL